MDPYHPTYACAECAGFAHKYRIGWDYARNVEINNCTNDGTSYCFGAAYSDNSTTCNNCLDHYGDWYGAPTAYLYCYRKNQTLMTLNLAC